MWHIRKVLQRLREWNFFINVKKYSFMKIDLVYLGFTISLEGLKMDPKKVREIIELPTMISIREVRSFHVLDSFH